MCGAVHVVDVRAARLCVRCVWSDGDSAQSSMSARVMSQSQPVLVVSTVSALWLVLGGWSQRPRRVHGRRLRWARERCRPLH